MSEDTPSIGKQARTAVAAVTAVVSGAAHQPGTVNTGDLNNARGVEATEAKDANDLDADAAKYNHGATSSEGKP